MSTQHIPALLRQLHERPRCPDWGAKVQFVTETIWNSHTTEDFGTAIIQDLISLLQQDEAFALARLVVPEFRVVDPTTDGLKRTIIDQTEGIRVRSLETENTTQFDFDTPLYRQEKEVFAEAEMYRASLLLHGTAAFDEVDAKEILEWLDKRPRKSTGSKSLSKKP
ncbi:hypothetical protein KCV07_g3763, partial [Aureobasidium melanogenum]